MSADDNSTTNPFWRGVPKGKAADYERVPHDPYMDGPEYNEPEPHTVWATADAKPGEIIRSNALADEEPDYEALARRDFNRAEHAKRGVENAQANPERTTAKDRQVAGAHYRQVPGMQPWDIIDAYGLDFYAGNALKYLLRAGRKGPKVVDLKKAIHYIERMIEMEEDE